MAKRKYTIFLDMDGVICDFNNAFKELSQKTVGMPLTFEEYGEKYGFKECDKIIKKTSISYWSNLKPLPNYKILVDYIFNNFDDVKILTASGVSGENAEIGKKVWLSKYNIPVGGNDIIIVKHSSNKRKYAGDNQILVDDFIRNIEQWKQAGGIPIHHTSVVNTIKQLEKYANFQSTNL